MSNMYVKHLFIVLGILIPCYEGLEMSHWGNYFVFTFLENRAQQGFTDNMIVITSRDAVDISIYFMETGESWNTSLGAYESYRLVLSEATTASPVGEILPQKALVVTASSKISVYGYSSTYQSADGFLVLPAAGLGTRYRVITADRPAQIAVIATQDYTNITVEISGANECYMSTKWDVIESTYKMVYTGILSAYDVINVYCIYDLTGTLVTSDAPVAILSGNNGTDSTLIHLIEMFPPVADFGEHFRFQAPSNSRCLITADEGTTVWYNGNTYTINPGGRLSIYLEEVKFVCLDTSKPVLVLLKDRYLSVVPPVSKYTNHYVILPYVIGHGSSYFDVMAQEDVSSKINSNLDLNEFEEECADFEHTATTSMTNGLARFTSTKPFLVMFTSLTYNNGFGFPAGMNLTDYSGEDECSDSPCSVNEWCLDLASSYACHNTVDPFTTLTESGLSIISDAPTTAGTVQPTRFDRTKGFSAGNSTIIDQPTSNPFLQLNSVKPLTTARTPPSDSSATRPTPQTTANGSQYSTHTEQASTSNHATADDRTFTGTAVMHTLPVIHTTQTSSQAPPKGDNTSISLSEIPTTTPRVFYPIDPPKPKKFCYHRKCLCACPCATKNKMGNVALYAKKVQQEILMDKQALSKTVRKSISADNMTSAERNLGMSALGIVGVLFILLISLDMPRFFSWCRENFAKSRYRRHFRGRKNKF